MKSLLYPLLSLALAGAANGALVIYTATLEGSQEVPAVTTSGSGSTSLSLETSDGSWTLTGSFINLTGNSTASHIHGPAPAGSNAGVVAGLTLGPAGGTSGTLSGAGTFTAGEMADLDAGLFYVNVHSTFAPGGEIRGQLVPESSASLLAAVGAVALLRRRRR